MSRRIYVDIDDVLALTIESLIDLLHRLHARRVPKEDVLSFDLGHSFALDDEALSHFMEHAHSDIEIEAIEPAPEALRVLSNWETHGHHVELVTGRPPSTRDASLRWCDRHGVAHQALHHVDKWSRPDWNPHGLPALGFEEIAARDYALAVEDSLDTAVRLVDELGIRVVLMDRPWNRDLSGLSRGIRERLVRCHGWLEVEREAERD